MGDSIFASVFAGRDGAARHQSNRVSYEVELH